MASISYEVSKFNPKPNTELVCSICFCVMHEARMCPCHHIFCNACIRRWLQNSTTCPTCRSLVSPRDLELAPPLVQNVLSSLTMDCDFKDKGCEKTIVKEHFPSHITNCEFRPVSCPHKDCDVEVKAKELQAHNEQCRYRSLRCSKLCHLMLPAHKLDDHDCFTAMENRVTELDSVIHRHQQVMGWLRKKLNLVQMPAESPRVQLQSYDEMMADINRYWPMDQPFPLMFCGSYVAPAIPLASSMAPSPQEQQPLAESPSTARLVAEIEREGNSAAVFDSPYPEGGSEAYPEGDGPVRGVIHESDLESHRGDLESHRAGDRAAYWNSDLSDDSSDFWDRPAQQGYPSWLHGAQGGGGDSPYHEDSLASHRYRSPVFSPHSARGGTRQAADMPGSHRPYAQVSESPQLSRSVFEEEQSHHIFDSSDNYSSYSELGYSPTYSDYQLPPRAGSPYSRHDQDPDYRPWNYSSPQTDPGSLHVEPGYYTGPRSRSTTPHYAERHERYSPAQHDSPTRSGSGSPSAARHHESSLSPSSDNSRSSSASPSGCGSRTGSRSPSTSRGQSSSRSASHPPCRRGTPSDSSDRSSPPQEEQSPDSNYWAKTDDNLNESSEEQNDWNVVLSPTWLTGLSNNNPSLGSKGTSGEVLNDYERSAVDSRNTYPAYGEGGTHDEDNISVVSVESVSSVRSRALLSSQQATSKNLHSPTCTNSSEGRGERKSSSDVAACEPNQRSNDSSEEIVLDPIHAEEQTEGHGHSSDSSAEVISGTEKSPHSRKSVTPRAEHSTSKCRITGEGGDQLVETRRQALQCHPPGCSYTRDENSALDPEKKSETEDRVVSSDGPDDKKNKRKSFDHNVSRNIWESSSDTTSLDYEIPAEESPPKSESGTGGNSPNASVEHTGDVPSTEAAHTSDKEQIGDNEDTHENNTRKNSSDHDNTNRNKTSAHIDSEESLLHHQRKRGAKSSPRGKGKALKRKRKSQVDAVDSNSDSDFEDSDSIVCFKRKMKAKVLDTSSNSEVSSRETEIHADELDGDDALKTSSHSNLPSTSRSSSEVAGKKKVKSKRKKEKRPDKKNVRYVPWKSTLKSEWTMKLKKRKPSKSKSNSSAKKPRLDSSSNLADSGAALMMSSSTSSNNLVHGEQKAVRQTDVPASNPKVAVSSEKLPHAQKLLQFLATCHGSEEAVCMPWTAPNTVRSTRSHTFSRQELSEGPDNGMDSGALSGGTANSRGRSISHRHGEAEGRRGSERRVIESHAARGAVDSQNDAQGVTAHHQDRDSVQGNTGGRRTMRIDNPRGSRGGRRRAAEENTRTVWIADVSGPPSSLQYNTGHDTDRPCRVFKHK